MLAERPISKSDIKLPAAAAANLNNLADYSAVESVSDIWTLAAKRFGSKIALKDPHAKPEVNITYQQLGQQIDRFAAALQSLDIPLGTDLPPRIALFSDNSPRWLIADQGIMRAGGADAVRSSQAEREELLYILEHSGSIVLVVEDYRTLQKLSAGDRLASLPLQCAILLSDERPEPQGNLQVFNFSEFIARGVDRPLKSIAPNRDRLATLMYTSGTTGKPKGVMLTHGNLLHQVVNFKVVVQPEVGDRVLSILPTWHVYERAVEYYLLSQGCTQIYTSLRHFKGDLKTFQPQYMAVVPRLLEAVYEGVQKQFREQPANKQRLVNFFLKISDRYIRARRIAQGLSLEDLNPSIGKRVSASLQSVAFKPLHALGDRLVYQKVRAATGGKIKQMISGGGSLAVHVDTFFETIGVDILVGYGLTETSPVTNVRRIWRNLRGSAGQPIPDTEVKIVDLETRKPLPTGQRGLVLLKGPQIMAGYYKNPEATAKAIDSQGWFDSGDLGWLSPERDLVLTGRAKDTIVLTNGENIEPQPIEDACLRSAYISQIMLVGQDRRSIGALIVPNLEALEVWAVSQNLRLNLPELPEKQTATAPEEKAIASSQPTEVKLDSKIVQELFRQELNREVQNRPGYRLDDRIGPFQLILEPFSIENGLLTQTLKIKRAVVMDRYGDTIDAMFDK
jgi:long-chain acyl-CoA synthetase